MGARSRIAKAWSRALDVPRASSVRAARRLRDAHPGATPAELVEIANKRFIARVSRESAAVGAIAAWPGVGTAASAGASGVQFLAFVSEAARHCLVVARLYGLDMRDPAKRSALVLAALTGQEGAEVISLQVGVQAVSWFRSSFLNVRTVSAERFNRLMLAWVRRRAAKSAAMSTIGRLVPFGVGAAVGWGIGAGLARTTIEGLTLALGPPPAAFTTPLLVDIEVTGDESASRAYERLELPVDEDGIAEADEAGAPRRGSRPGPKVVDSTALDAE